MIYLIPSGIITTVDATLCIAGNSLPYQELALQLPLDTLRWTLVGPATDHRRSQERQDILSLLEEHHSVPLTPKHIASLLHKDPRAITKLLFNMSRANEIRVVARGQYISLNAEPPTRFSFVDNVLKITRSWDNSNNADHSNDRRNSNNANLGNHYA